MCYISNSVVLLVWQRYFQSDHHQFPAQVLRSGILETAFSKGNKFLLSSGKFTALIIARRPRELDGFGKIHSYFLR